MQFSLVNLFESMGFGVSFNENSTLLIGYPDCMPLAAVVQTSSHYLMDETEVNVLLQRAQKECVGISFTIILNFGGFTCHPGNYKNQAFLVDRRLMEQMICEKDVLHGIMLEIIKEKGNPPSGSSLEQWVKNRVRLFSKNKIDKNEVAILTKAGFIKSKKLCFDDWSNNLLKYMSYVQKTGSGSKMPAVLKEWGKEQYDKWEKGELSARKITQMMHYGALWKDGTDLSIKYDELLEFIYANGRLPFDYECKLFRFMQEEMSATHSRADELRKLADEYDLSDGSENEKWLVQLQEVVREFKSAKRRIWKLSPESIAWINNSSAQAGVFKRKELKLQLKCTGEQYDYEWLRGLDAYSQQNEPPERNSEMWVWAVRQRRPDLEKYKHKALRKIKFDFNGEINNQWYGCYERISNANPAGRRGVYHAGKDCIYWAYSNRKAYAEGTLPNEKLILLKEIGFDFKEEEFVWLAHFEKIKDFYRVEGVFRNHRLTAKMISWCSQQRKALASIDLMMTRTEKLLAIGFVVNDQGFEEFIKQLKEIVVRYKTLPKEFETYSWIACHPHRLAYAREVYLLINSDMVGEERVFDAYYPLLLEFWRNDEERWLMYTDKIQDCGSYLRIMHRNKMLDEDVCRELNDAGFQWEDEEVEKWLYMLSKTEHFIRRYKLMPSYKHKDCSVWRFSQLRLYNAGKLSEFRRIAIEPILNKRKQNLL